MKYWWVNQNQTFRQEFKGGYMWSPKRNKDDGKNRFYDNMRAVAPDDIVFSFVDTRIIAIGHIRSIGYECPRPTEFGTIGQQWNEVGWRVDVDYKQLQNRVRPKDFMSVLTTLLPAKYSPLTKEGNGLQSVYLAEVPESMARALIDLIGIEAVNLTRMIVRDSHDTEFIVPLAIKEQWEQHQEEQVKQMKGISETEKDALIKARRGQGAFREEVCTIEHSCRITRISNPKYLVASHIKPWRHSQNEERLDGENGLMLCPNIDLLFDRGLISFEDRGEVLISPVADKGVLEKMSVRTTARMNVGNFSEGQRSYLEFHRQNIFLQVV